ncbi:hypothetical protein JOF53_006453 [Crossiella equi]|uniref:Uncharacterized protein n=1 Tax=Crossiella equi TaxID=130796 RepID=A0ABS5AM05_9PSEU|nr:hypothetical protein [Crossiella equi]MBP2477581.1 hypothetical protein [Crossiella equi]
MSAEHPADIVREALVTALTVHLHTGLGLSLAETELVETRLTALALPLSGRERTAPPIQVGDPAQRLRYQQVLDEIYAANRPASPPGHLVITLSAWADTTLTLLLTCYQLTDPEHATIARQLRDLLAELGLRDDEDSRRAHHEPGDWSTPSP